MNWLVPVEIVLIRTHVGLKLDSIFWGHELRVLMIVLEVVVNVRLMEMTSRSQCRTSNSSTSLLRETTLVVAEVVDIVLVSLLLELLKTGCGIASSSWGVYRSVSRGISHVWS